MFKQEIIVDYFDRKIGYLEMILLEYKIERRN